MIGFTRNEVQFEREDADAVEEATDFDAFRAGLLNLKSVEIQDAYEQYNRSHRVF